MRTRTMDIVFITLFTILLTAIITFVVYNKSYKGVVDSFTEFKEVVSGDKGTLDIDSMIEGILNGE